MKSVLELPGQRRSARPTVDDYAVPGARHEKSPAAHLNTMALIR